jgi:adenylate cyclase, class 2
MTELDAASARALREMLEAALPVRVRVRKRREILFIDNVKFHLDRVEGLGAFVEIEAQSRGGAPARSVLEAQTAEWRALLGIEDRDLEPRSYSDLLSPA